MSLTSFTAFRLALVLVLTCMALGACSPTPARKYTLTISASEGGAVNLNGVVRALPWSGSFDQGTVVTILAVAESGFEFLNWSGDHLSSDNPISLTVRSNTTINPHFTRLPTLVITPANGDFGSVQIGETRQVTFTVANHGGGTIRGTVQTEAPFSVESGASLHLAEGQSQQVQVRFSPTVAGVTQANLSVAGNVLGSARLTGTATVAPINLRALDVSVVGDGTIYSEPAGILCPGTCSATFELGTDVTLSVAPGSAVDSPRWTGCQIPMRSGVASGTCVVSMSTDRIVFANFTLEPLLVTTPPAIDFGSVQVGQHRDVTMTVANHGGGTLNGVVEASAPFSIVSGAVYSLRAGESQAVSVRYAPSAEGLATGQLTLTGGHTVAISGFGAAVPVVTRMLHVNIQGSGRVVSEPAGIDCPGACSGQFELGTNLVLTGTPTASSGQVSWTGCDTPSGTGSVSGTCQLELNAARTITAEFTTPELISVSIVPGSATMFTNDSRSFTAAVTGTDDQRVLWTTTGGSLTGSGTTISYTAPGTPGSYTLTATSLANPAASASTSILVDPRLVVEVTGGDGFSLARRNDGSVWAWGENGQGQLGLGHSNTTLTPTQIPTLYNVIKIASNGSQAAALRSDGTLWLWGAGQAGLIPTRHWDFTDVIDIALGLGHFVVVEGSGRVSAWGSNYYGQLGDGTTETRWYPLEVPGLSSIRAVAAGENHSIAIDTEGRAFAWGFNNFSASGESVPGDEVCSMYFSCAPTPRPVGFWPGGSVFGGAYSSYALSDYGTVFSWGHNGYGQLGVVTGEECWVYSQPVDHACSRSPVRVADLSPVSDIAVGSLHVVAVTASGLVYTWGSALEGQLGAPSSDLCRPGATPWFECSQTPLLVPTLTGAVSAGAGTYHSLAVLSNGTVWAWGANDSGQLGDGTTVLRRAPVMVQFP